MKPTQLLLFMRDGSIQSHQTLQAAELEVFDWDDFEDDPEFYWNNFPPKWKAFLKEGNPALYDEISLRAQLVSAT